jgi:pantetheine-phosphate adenylyltransferase
MDIVSRALQLVDKLVIGIAENSQKAPFFTANERVKMIQEETFHFGESVTVQPFSNLLIEFAKQIDAKVIIRGLRAVSDFEYEFQMVGMNRALCPKTEMVFLMADAHYQAIASRLVKEVAYLGGDVTPFVSPSIAEKIYAKIKAENKL